MKNRIRIIAATALAAAAMCVAELTYGATLSIGNSGDEVYKLQELLAQRGYFYATPTGYFGDLTLSALLAFQADNGLDVDGLAGPVTQNCLGLATAGSSYTAASASAADTSSAALSRTLKNGMSGDDVYTLQNLLASFGYFYATPTGYFGDLTEAALMAFQTDYGLAADGLAGPITQNCLLQGTANNYASGSADGQSSEVVFSRTLENGMSGDDVSALQELLAEYGYFYGNVTGYFGDLTESAVMNFQREYGLVIDGIAGSATLAVLTGTAGDDTANFNGYGADYQAAVLAAIDATPSPGAGLCAAWVSQVFRNAGVLTYDITTLRPYFFSYAVTSGLADEYYKDDTDFNANDYWAYVCYSNDLSDLEPGMVVASRSSYSYLGQQFGHVGIYIGNGQVISSVGYLETLSLYDWEYYYNNEEMGSTVYWGFLPYQ